MQAKQIFLAEDGTQFESEEEAQSYESVMAMKPAVEKWVENHYDNKRFTARYTKIILAWEAVRAQVMQAVPETEAVI